MKDQPNLELCLAFINSQLEARAPFGSQSDAAPRWAITISREAGCGASIVAEKLIEYLQEKGGASAVPWSVFDRNLVEKVLEDHHLPKRLARFMPEDRITELADIMDELFGLHPPSWLFVRQTAETIFQLAQLGHVILIGRGGNLVTRNLPYAFHVRLVGSLRKRMERVQQFYYLQEKEALTFIRLTDRGRQRYIRKYFGKDINDPLNYHLVINTDLVAVEESARIIGDALQHASLDSRRKVAQSGQLPPCAL
jgi:cytidylate kinase